jgi:hypothetical protein
MPLATGGGTVTTGLLPCPGIRAVRLLEDVQGVLGRPKKWRLRLPVGFVGQAPDLFAQTSQFGAQAPCLRE